MANANSKLEPYREFINAERKRRTTYRRIRELLAEKGVEVDHSTIHSFVKVRSKPQRPVITMLDSEPAITSQADAPTQPASAGTPGNSEAANTQAEAIRRLKNAKPTPKKHEKGLKSFNPDAPLDRVDPKKQRRKKDQ